MKRALGFAYLALMALGLIHTLSPRLAAQNPHTGTEAISLETGRVFTGRELPRRQLLHERAARAGGMSRPP